MKGFGVCNWRGRVSSFEMGKAVAGEQFYTVVGEGVCGPSSQNL